mmetsp:Transcript_53213/g.141497  ORF Transcript_53213/g.141497 Transcript_53213/m.141497 type:complete len:151 (+) Transcript_53213:798-1250(+)
MRLRHRAGSAFWRRGKLGRGLRSVSTTACCAERHSSPAHRAKCACSPQACTPDVVQGIDTYRTWEALLSGAVPIVSPEALRIVSHARCPAVSAVYSEITSEELSSIVNQTVPVPSVSARCVEALFLAFWGRQFYAGRSRRTFPAQRSPWQ